jgi:undecaprenyl-diphosphatase
MGSVSLIPLLATAGFLLVFGLVARAASARKPSTFDAYVMAALRTSAAEPVPIGPAWLQEAARDVTSLGSVVVLTAITFAIAGYLYLTRKPGIAWLMLIAVLGGLALNSLLKFAFARPRPGLVTHAPRVFTASFPSGHATLSAIAYLTIAALLAPTSHSFALSVYFISLAILLTGLVGLSRIYLGVHFPTDVLAGWCLGAVWAIGCWYLTAWLQQGGHVEPPSPA